MLILRKTILKIEGNHKGYMSLKKFEHQQEVQLLVEQVKLENTSLYDTCTIEFIQRLTERLLMPHW